MICTVSVISIGTNCHHTREKAKGDLREDLPFPEKESVEERDSSEEGLSPPSASDVPLYFSLSLSFSFLQARARTKRMLTSNQSRRYARSQINEEENGGKSKVTLFDASLLS